jgi:O-antigen/teichoic acid export membrane protein
MAVQRSSSLFSIISKFLFGDSDMKNLARNSSWVFISNNYKTLLVFLRSIVIARFMGVEFFGVYAFIYAQIATLQQFLNMNIPDMLIRFGGDYHYKDQPQKLVSTLKAGLLVIAASAVIYFGICYPIFSLSDQIRSFGIGDEVLLFAGACAFRYLDDLSQSLLRIFLKFRFNSVLQIITYSLDFLIVSTVIIMNPHNLKIFFVAIIISRVLTSMILNTSVFIELRRELLPWLSSGIRAILPDLKPMIRFTLGNSVFMSLHTLKREGDVLLLGIWTNPVIVGVYSAAKRMAFGIMVLADPLVNAVYPQLVGMVSGEKKKKMQSFLKKATKILVISAIILIPLAIIFGRWLFRTVLGPGFELSYIPFLILLSGSLVGFILFWVIPLLRSLNKTGVLILTQLITLASGLALAYWLTPLWEASGMAIALSVSLLAGIISAFPFIRKSLKEDEVQQSFNGS